jgi:hypothetical protein
MALRSYTCADCGRWHRAFSDEQPWRCFICQCIAELTRHQRPPRIQASAGASAGITAFFTKLVAHPRATQTSRRGEIRSRAHGVARFRTPALLRDTAPLFRRDTDC